jgi:hypothetical protein
MNCFFSTDIALEKAAAMSGGAGYYSNDAAGGGYSLKGGPGLTDPSLARQKHHHRKAFEYISKALRIDEEGGLYGIQNNVMYFN